MDSAGDLIQETNVTALLPAHVAAERAKLDDLIFPAVQIEDALPLILRHALADLVYGYMLLEPVKIASYGEPGCSGPHMTDKKRKKLDCYQYVFNNLVWAHREILIDGRDSFCKLIARDVGKSRGRRKKIGDAMHRIGTNKINRRDRARAISGYAGYIRAAAEAVQELNVKFDIEQQRKRREQERVKNLNHEHALMDELEAEIVKLKRVSKSY